MSAFSLSGPCRRPKFLWIGVGFLLIAFWLRVYLLQETALDPDEYRRIMLNVGVPWAEALLLYRLAFVLAKMSISVSGETFFTLRWPSVVLGMLSLALLWRLAHEMLGRRVATVSVLFMTFSPWHIAWSRRLNTYAILVFFCLLSTYFFARTLRTRRWVSFLGFAVTAIVSIYIHPFALLLLAAQVIFVGVLGWRQWTKAGQPGRKQVRWRLVLLTALGSVVLIGIAGAISNPFPQVMTMLNPTPETPARPFSDTYDVFRQMGQGEWRFSPPYNCITVIMAFWAILGLFAPSGDRWSRTALGIWLFVPIALSIGAYWLTPAFGVYFRPRFLSFLMPPYYVLAARGVTILADGLRIGKIAGRLSLWRSALLALGTVVLDILPLTWYFPVYTDGNWQAVSSYLKAQLRPNDMVVCALHSEPVDLQASTCLFNLRYHLQDRTIYPIEYIGEMATYKAAAQQAIRARYPDRVWMVVWNIGEMPPALQEAAVATFSDFGKSSILLADGGSLVNNLIALLQTIENITPDARLRLHYRLRRAELLIATGQHQAALEALASAEALADSETDHEEIARVRELLSYPPLVTTPQVNLQAIFGDQIELLGYRLSPSTPSSGQQLELTLFWKTLRPVSENYTIFLHFRDSTGRLVWQQDFQPFDGTHPTTAWKPGDTIEETRRFLIPTGVPPGDYSIYLGLYQLETLKRLPLENDASGENAVIIEPIALLPQ